MQTKTRKPTKTRRSTKSTSASNSKHEEALNKLEQGILALQSSEDWAKYLKVQASFHYYSFSNAMLIAAQCPHATRVAGYEAWQQKFKRQVRKGEKGICILAPTIGNKEEDGEQKKVLFGFKLAYVYDISQTDGEPLPEAIHKLEGETELYDRLVEVIRDMKLKFAEEELEANLGGYCRYDNEGKAFKIAVNRANSGLQKAKTLAHELGHAILHGAEDYMAHRGDRELEAESVAFVVLNHFGIDTGNYSFGYVASWQGNKSQEDCIATLKASGDRISQASKQIIDSIEK